MTIAQLSTVHRTRDNRIYNKECRALLERGLKLTLVIRSDCDESTPVPITALTSPRTRVQRLTSMQVQAWRRLTKLRPRVVHIHDPELIPMALLWARTHGAKVVFDAHEDLVKQIDTKPYLSGWRRRAARAYARFLTRTADRYFDAVVAATGDIADAFTNRNLVTVFNYPWLSDFMEARHPVPGRLVYVGDLTQERKLGFMIDVVLRVRERVPHAHLVLAGALGPRLEDVAHRFDEDAVRYMGLLSPTDVPALLATADLGLIFLAPLPNYLNSLPTKLFEYQASGLPVVASSFPRWLEAFERDGATAFADTDDVQATADVIVGLLHDDQRRRQMSISGREAVARKYNFESQAEGLDRLMRRLIGSPT